MAEYHIFILLAEILSFIRILEINGIAEIEKDTFYLNGQSISFERRNLQNVKGLWL